MRVPNEIGAGQETFVLGELLGSGAMGVVYAGEGRKGERVAVKFLHPHLAEVPDVLERFQREATTVCRIRSPFIAQVLLAGRTKGLWWIVYKRLEGETLADRMARVRVLPAVVARPFVGHVLTGLGAAHGAGVIHRDVKPANIFLEREESSERACILDFGISKYTPPPGSTTSQHPLTSTSDVLGTTSYMAPEQAEGATHVDRRADLFAVGEVAFQMLTGVLPFAGDSPMSIINAKLLGRPRSLTAATRLPWRKRLEAFFEKALARRPDDRFATATEMLDAWQTVAGSGAWPSVDRVRAQLDSASGPTTDDTLEASGLSGGSGARAFNANRRVV